MKEFKVTLGGADRPIRFTAGVGKELKTRFKKPLKALMLEDVLGCDAAGNTVGNYDWDTVFATLALSLNEGAKHAGIKKRVSESEVERWIQEEVLDKPDEGNLLMTLLPVVKAAFYSGVVLGRSEDLDVASGQAEGEEGKAQASETTPAVKAE